MTKLKIGDWVKVGNVIGRVIKANGNMAIVKTLEDTSSHYVDDLTKLPIKFKGFEIKQEWYGSWGPGDGVVERRKIIQGNSQARFFTEAVDTTMKLFIGHVGKPYAIQSQPMAIEQARDWLEHQYATMLTKARGANLMEGKFIAIDMEEQTVFILSGDSEYLKQQEDTLLSRGGTLIHEQEKINDTISMMAFELTKTRVLF